MDRVLSPEEIAALLAVVKQDQVTVPGASASTRAVTAYNFRRPNRVSKEQVRMLYSIHESFARLYSASLTTLLRGVVEMEVNAVEQVTFGEFAAALSPPTCVVIFNMEPLRGGAALEISANILFCLIDRLLGGSGLLTLRPREFTEVEQVLIERLAVRAMVDLQQAWQHAGAFAFRIAHLETNPQFLHLTAASEIVIVVTFSMTAGDERGLMTLAFPHLLLEPALPKLSTHRYFATAYRELSSQEQEDLREAVLRLGVTVRGVLAEVPITVRRLLELTVGDVVSLGRPATAPATIEIEGMPRFTGRPGTANRHRALKLLAVIPKGELIRDTGARDRTARVFTS